MPKKTYDVDLTKVDKFRSTTNYSTDTVAKITTSSARTERAIASVDTSGDPLPRGVTFSNCFFSISTKKGLGGNIFNNDLTDGALDLQVLLVSGAGAVAQTHLTWDNRNLSTTWSTGGGDYYTRDRGRMDMTDYSGLDGDVIDLRVSRLMGLDQRKGINDPGFVIRWRYEGSSGAANKLVPYTDNEGTKPTPVLTLHYRKTVMRSRRNRMAR